MRGRRKAEEVPRGSDRPGLRAGGDKEDAAPSAPPAPPTLLTLFGVFFGISAVTLGGGYAMVPVIGSALEKRGWVGEAEFFDLFAQAQSFPGPLAFTTALMVGKRLLGAKGATASGLGVILPPFAAIVLVGALLGRVGQLPPVRHFLDGAGATVPGLVAAMIWKVARSRKWNLPRVAATVALTAALSAFPGLTLPIFFGALLLLYFMETRWKYSPSSGPSSR
jgi:chromate transporter